MVMLDGLLVVAVAALVLYGLFSWVLGQQKRDQASGPATWRVAHYDVDGVTRVVVQRCAVESGKVLDEHLVAAVHVDDPAYDEEFLSAMATARQRQALFEAQED
jgi:hypothetical protein